MKRLRVVLLLFCLSVVTVSGQKQTTVRKKATTTKTVSPKQPAKKQTTSKKQTTTKKMTTTKKKTATKEQPVTVKGLQNQRQQLQKQMKEQERKLRQNEQDVKKRLQTLMIINTEISDKRRTIDTIRRDINTLDGNIQVLDLQVKNWEKDLEARKDRFKKSVRYMHRNRNIQNQLMFIFSAKNFSQMFRRMRFMREYAVFQRAQGEAVQFMQQQVAEAVEELSGVKKQKNDLLYRGEQEKKSLESKQVEQQKVVTSLQKEQKTIQSVLEQQRKKDAALNAQIDQLIAEEIARAKARAEAERKKKAAEEARKKAAAEAAARENARKIQEAKEKEAKAKAEARAAARKSEREKAAAEKAAREAENARREAERKAANEAAAHEKEMAEAKKKSEESWTVSSVDRQLSGNFESNRGRFPMPITGPYRIVNTQGQHRVEGLKGTTVQETKGIELKGQPGANVRCIFDGEVSRIVNYRGAVIVIVRHGTYFSVYSDLSSVNVKSGQKVSTRQVIGSVSQDGTMKFQLRRLSGALLNPLSWLSR